MLKLLVVDDSSVIRNKIARINDRSLFRVMASAANGEEALQLCESGLPDVVTMDITMPHMDGIRCIREMIARDPQIRILVVSALADRETALEALEAGARGFLCKPFSDDQLKEALETLVME